LRFDFLLRLTSYCPTFLTSRVSTLYYFKQRNECDFVIKDGLRLQSALQVRRAITSNNRKREIAGIVEACKVFGLKSGMILTYDQEERIQKDGIKISLLPAWKWLLTNNTAELSGDESRPLR